MAELLFSAIDSASLEAVDGSSVDGAESRAKFALGRSQIFVLRKLHVEQDGEAIVLRGRVDSFYHKQLAQELVRMAIEGVEVINAISVVYSHRADDSSLDFHW